MRKKLISALIAVAALVASLWVYQAKFAEQATSRLGVMGIDGSSIYRWYGSNAIITKKEPIRIYGTLYTNSLIGTNFDWTAP